MKDAIPLPESTGRSVRRVVPDVTALKALAHPVRMRMLGLLRVDGPATATQLASRLGLNSGATSYHLRQLAHHGFIEDAPSASRRDRMWRACHEVTSVPAETNEGEVLDAGLAFTQAALSAQVGQMQQALDEYVDLPPAWRAASTASDLTIPLSAEQAKALTDKLTEIILQAMRDAPPLGQAHPQHVVPFSVMLHAFPYPGRLPHHGEEDE